MYNGLNFVQYREPKLKQEVFQIPGPGSYYPERASKFQRSNVVQQNPNQIRTFSKQQIREIQMQLVLQSRVCPQQNENYMNSYTRYQSANCGYQLAMQDTFKTYGCGKFGQKHILDYRTKTEFINTAEQFNKLKKPTPIRKNRAVIEIE